MAEASPFHSQDPQLRLISGAAYLGLLVFFSLLQRLQLELRGTETRNWWASNGRDVVNGLAVALLAWGLRAMGYPGPAALLLAGTIVVLSTAVQPALENSRHRQASLLAMSLALGLPPLLAPGPILDWVQRGLAALF